MKKILLLIPLTFTTLYAKPCMTDIYTLNGINTDDISINTDAGSAEDNMIHLEEFMLHWGSLSTRLDPQKNGKEYQFRYVYNPSYGVRDDMLETYYQLKESGQISGGYFTFLLNLLTVDLGLTGLVEKYKEIVSRYEGDVQGIYNAYNASSFSQKHNLLLVAHSQGNLMGNKIYTMLTEAQKKKFRMVSVGTPANHVMKPNQTAPYVTARGDFVINGVYGALSGNVEGIGHNFINIYLGSSFDARTQIALYVKSTYDNLMQTTSCSECSFLRTKVSDINKMTIECQVFGTYRTEIIATFDAKKYDANILPNGNEGCGVPFDYPGGISLSLTNEEGIYSWNTGHFSSKNNLLTKKDREESYLYLNSDQCITLSVSGDYYDLVKSVLVQ